MRFLLKQIILLEFINSVILNIAVRWDDVHDKFFFQQPTKLQCCSRAQIIQCLFDDDKLHLYILSFRYSYTIETLYIPDLLAIINPCNNLLYEHIKGHPLAFQINVCAFLKQNFSAIQCLELRRDIQETAEIETGVLLIQKMNNAITEVDVYIVHFISTCELDESKNAFMHQYGCFYLPILCVIGPSVFITAALNNGKRVRAVTVIFVGVYKSSKTTLKAFCDVLKSTAEFNRVHDYIKKAIKNGHSILPCNFLEAFDEVESFKNRC